MLTALTYARMLTVSTSWHNEPVTRHGYHHGDLANALTTAATELARQGGPEAVVLRAAARQVGVSATAAYRHFADHNALVLVVKHRAQDELVEAMRAELARLPAADDPGTAGLARLRALGAGYLRFALTEPGLFRAAFCKLDEPPAEVRGLIDGAPAYQLLGEVLDDLVDAGVVPPARRPLAEVAAWAPVHGLAHLILDGPLAALGPDERAAALSRTVDTIIAGLSRP
jgi:AcrR family transcriptional regulator